MSFMRSQAACLVARVGHLGQAARECVGRRTLAMAEGVRVRQEAAAYHTAHIRGRGSCSQDCQTLPLGERVWVRDDL